MQRYSKGRCAHTSWRYLLPSYLSIVAVELLEVEEYFVGIVNAEMNFKDEGWARKVVAGDLTRRVYARPFRVSFRFTR